MANIKSAIKRIKTTKRNNQVNRFYKSTIKTFTKKYLLATKNYKENPTPENLSLVQNNLSIVYSKIDKAIKKNIYHKNNGARKKSRLYKVLKTLTTS
mgnify:CR=1 FL=1|jgi:small subunit ribosomal protein S20